MSAIAEFYIVPGQPTSLLGRKTSEMRAILKIGINVKNCTTNIDCAQSRDNKAALKLKFLNVFEGRGRLNGYQRKLHKEDSVSPVAQPLLRIPFSRRQKVAAKLKQLE